MNKTATIILAAAALVGVTAAAIIAAVKSGAFENLEEGEEREPTPSQCFKRIAKALDRDIQNVERRTSELYHDKNREKYEKLDWDEEQTQREDIAKNGCPFPVG
jgi:hypothetical protein